MKVTVFSVLACISLASPVALAQVNGAAPATIHVNSRLVVLDVVVTDKDGKIVTGLTKDDFVVMEDKRPQVIRNFEATDGHQMPVGPAGMALVSSAADLKKIDNAPVTVLVMDELSTQFEDMAYGRYCLENYLKRQPLILTQPTIVIAVSYGKFEVIHDFSQSRDELLDAIHKHKATYPAQLARTGNKGAGGGERMAMAIESLSQIAKSQMGTPGRKNIIWVGKGFPSFDPSTADATTIALVETVLRRVTDLMLRSHVTLFIVDPEGVPSGSTGEVETAEDLSSLEDRMSEVSPFDGPFSFSNLAPATGGRSFLHRNDVDAEIASSVSDGGNYYTLSYVPNNAGADEQRYRRIRITLKRPGLHAMTRDGYYPAGGEAPAVTPVELEAAQKHTDSVLQADLENAAMNHMTYNGLDVGVQPGQPGAYQLNVKAADLQWEEVSGGQFESDVVLYAVSFSGKGKVVGRAGLRVKKDATSAPVGNSTAHVVFTLPFHVPSGSVRLRFVVRDAVSGKMGTADMKL